MSSRHDKNHIKDSFENLRTWGIHKPPYFFLKIKDLTNMLWKCKFFPSILSQLLLISSFLTSDLGWLCWALYLLLIKVSVRYKNRPCLGREWVIDHQYLRRLRSNNRVLQIIAFLDTHGISFNLLGSKSSGLSHSKGSIRNFLMFVCTKLSLGKICPEGSWY